MFDRFQGFWATFWDIEHIRVYLTMAWLAYLIGLGIWIVLQKREPVATLSWLMGLAALPYIGLLVYVLIGPQRIKRFRLRRSRARVAALAEAEKLERSEQVELSRLATATTEFVPTSATDVHLLIDGHAKYTHLLKDIAEAKHHIHLEYYIYAADEVGTAIRDALVERARAGVTVRLLLDALGSSRATEKYFKPLLDAGGEIAWFHPTHFSRIWKFWRRPWVNMRSHRKIVVIDSLIGYTGGINVTIEEDESRRDDAYRDLHMRMTGKVVLQLQQIFVEDWAYSTGHREFISQVARTLPALEEGRFCVQAIPSGPDSDWEAIHRVHVGAIHAARKRVWLLTPYFVPGEAALMALTSAALAGLDVRLMVPHRSDSLLVTLAARSYFDRLLAAGVKIYQYGPRMLHTKAMLVDDDIALIGTANFDPRSFRLNFEVTMLFNDEEVASALEKQILAEFPSAPRVRDPGKRPWLTAQLPEAVARLMSPLL